MSEVVMSGAVCAETPRLLPELGALAAAVEKAAALDPGVLPLEALGTWACGLMSLEARLAGVTARAFAAADAAQVQLSSGHRSLASHVAAVTRCDRSHAGARLTLGRFLAEAPLFAEALLVGQISVGHANVMRLALNARNRPAFAADEEQLVTQATRMSAEDFSQVVGYWDNAADPDGTKPAAQRAKRFLDVKRLPDGTVKGAFLLDPISGEAVINAVHQESQRLRKEDLHLPKGHQPRSRGQLGADALTGMIIRGAARNSQGCLPKPLLQLVMSQQVAEAALAHGADPTVVIPLDRDSVDGRCELVDGTPMHPALAIGALAVAELRRLVLGAAGEILDYGRAVRCFPAHLRDAIKARDRGHCQITPGCDVPHQWLDIDHAQPWQAFGPTSVANGRCGCTTENRNPRPATPPARQ